jgi:hypothetical protein
MDNISLFLFLSGLFITTSAYSQSSNQEKTNKSQFVSPLDIPLFLSSNYGEYRSGHFHAGVDFKTQQVEGKNVYASDSGYVYRVVVLTGGYGNALYIKHPSGLITLYGHLSRFEPSIEKYVKTQQYNKKSFTVELSPPENKFVFRKGQFIGWSGNSGGSFGAHLHFEVRDGSRSVPLNPLRYGFDVKDKTRPELMWLMLYSKDTSSSVNGIRQNLSVKIRHTAKKDFIDPDTISVSGIIGLGLETYDFLDNTSNQCGPASIEVKLDTKPYFLCNIDSVSFDAANYINSYYDYGEMLRSGRKFQKLFIDPNNNLSIFKKAENRGILQFADSKVHEIEITVTDTYGNQSGLKFYLRPVHHVSENMQTDTTVVAHFSYDSLNIFENGQVRVVIPKNSLFDGIDFQYKEMQNDSFPYSPVHDIHNRYTPLLSSYILSIKAEHLPEPLRHKAYLALRGSKGSWISQGGDYKNGFVTGRVRTFGEYTIAVDTVVPVIRPVGFKPQAKYKPDDVISFIIADTLSGIQKYSGYIDKSWCLFEYDAKNDLLSYKIDKSRLSRDKLHHLEIIVTDNKGNTARYNSTFYY